MRGNRVARLAWTKPLMKKKRLTARREWFTYIVVSPKKSKSKIKI
jgi:hypothetical protein